MNTYRVPGNQFPDEPYSLVSPEAIRERLDMVSAAHVQPLNHLVEVFREELGVGMPCFDPFDAGVYAEALILLESPGAQVVGINFVSRNNPDRTAKNIFDILSASEIARKRPQHRERQHSNPSVLRSPLATPDTPLVHGDLKSTWADIGRSLPLAVRRADGAR